MICFEFANQGQEPSDDVRRYAGVDERRQLGSRPARAGLDDWRRWRIVEPFEEICDFLIENSAEFPKPAATDPVFFPSRIFEFAEMTDRRIRRARFGTSRALSEPREDARLRERQQDGLT